MSDDVVRRFGPFELRGPMGELYRNSERVRLQEQPRRLLLYLFEHAGDLISRDALRQHLWPDEQFVDFEHGLNTAIKKIREALGDSAADPQYIETVPRQGYRFLLQPAVGRNRRRYLRPAVAIAAGLSAVLIAGFLVQRPSPQRVVSAIAVLPLTNLSGDAKQEYLADGVTDALITDLGQLGGLSVISRTSVMQYKGTRKPVSQIARELGVDAIVEGSVMASRDRIRVTTHLIDAASERPLWTETHERDLTDAMVLQDETARAIARRIDLTLSRSPRPLPPFNAEAEEAYVHGIDEADKFTPAGNAAAIAYFREAIRLEPQYAQAWAGLSAAYNVSMMARLAPVNSNLPLSEAAATRALQLDANSAQAHLARGELFCIERAWNRCEQEYRHAILLNPNDGNAHLMLGYHLVSVERKSDEAISEMRRAVALDPLSASKRNALAASFFFAARYDDSLQAMLDLPDGDVNTMTRHRRRFWIYDHKGLEKQAVHELTALSHLLGDDALAASLENEYRTAGYRECRRTFLRAAVHLSGDSAINARYFALLGENDAAFAALEEAMANQDLSLNYLRVEPFLDNIKADPRFATVLTRLALDDCSVSLGRPASPADCAASRPAAGMNLQPQPVAR